MDFLGKKSSQRYLVQNTISRVMVNFADERISEFLISALELRFFAKKLLRSFASELHDQKNWP